MKFDVNVQDRNVKAFLDTIARCEGANYNTLFGGSTFSDYSKHPGYQNRYVTIAGSTFKPSASGRYQFILTTWNSVAKKLGLTDFSPKNQDRAAVELIAQRGAYDDVVNGRFQDAVKKCSPEWASLPYSTAGQNPKKYETVLNYYKGYGGKVNA